MCSVQWSLIGCLKILWSRRGGFTKLSAMGYTMSMETRTIVSGLDLICETLGISLETLAKRARVASEDLDMARDGRWHPTTLVRLSEHLGVSPDFFEIPTKYLTELLKAFSVVEPSRRLTLIDKIWTIETVWSAIRENCVLPNPRSLRLSDLLEAYSDHPVRGRGSFVAFVRRELERSQVLVFSHPFENRDCRAILFVPGEHFSPFKYLVVNRCELSLSPSIQLCQLSPLTDALFQWYEVLRLLFRWDNPDDENGFSLDPAALWTAVYLEPTVNGYCSLLNEQLHRHLILHDLSVIYFGGSNSDTLDLKQYWLHSVFCALMEGLPPAVVAEYFSRRLESGDEETDEKDEIIKQIVQPLNDPMLVDEIVKQIVEQRIVPTDYDWVIHSYPSFIKRLAVDAFEKRRIPRHLMLRVLSISDDEYNALLEKVERFNIYNFSMKP